MEDIEFKTQPNVGDKSICGLWKITYIKHDSIHMKPETRAAFHYPDDFKQITLTTQTTTTITVKPYEFKKTEDFEEGISIRLANCLRSQMISSHRDLYLLIETSPLTPKETLLSIKNFGKSTLFELIELMKERGDTKFLAYFVTGI